jgi:hypothetical protein
MALITTFTLKPELEEEKEKGPAESAEPSMSFPLLNT